MKVAAAGLGAGLAWPALGALLNRVAGGMVEAMVWLTGVFARLPGGNAAVAPWPPLLVAAWYAAVAVVAFALHVEAERREEPF